MAKRWGTLAGASLFYVLTAAAAAAAPAITSVAPPAAGKYGLGWPMNVVVTFNAQIAVTGTPMLQLRVGSVTRQATYDSFYKEATKVTFRYQPQAGDSGTLSIPGPITLNGGTIKGTDGADASLTFTPVDAPSVSVDTVKPASPVIKSVTPAEPTSAQSFTIAGTAEPGTLIGVWGETITRPTADVSGNWSITFTARPSGTREIPFYAEDDARNTSDTNYYKITIRPTGATPTITKVTPPPDGFYGPSYEWSEHWLRISVQFSDTVVITGSPSLEFRIGSTVRQSGPPINASSGSSTTSLVFLFSPSAGNGSLTITGPLALNGGSIKSLDGTDASLAFAPVDAPRVILDNIDPAPPTVQGVTPATPTPADSFTISGTAEPSVTVWSDESRSATVDANGNWSITYPPRAAGTYTLRFYAQDRAGNPWGAMGANPIKWTSFALTVQGTATPPPPTTVPAPVITAMSEDTGLPDGHVTTDLSPELRGTAAPNMTITLWENTAIRGTTHSDAGGRWSITDTRAEYPLGFISYTATATDAAGNVSARSNPFDVFPVPPVRFFLDNLQLPAGQAVDREWITLGPSMNFSPTLTATGLPPGLSLSSTGRLTGTPTVAGQYTVVVRGTSAPTIEDKTVTITVTAATLPPPVTTPPPATPAPLPPVTTPPPATPPINTPPPVVTTPPAAPVLATQQITFVSPVSGFVIGQPVTLSATSTANLPITFSLVSGNATLNGNVLTATGPGPVIVRAAQAGNSEFAPATTDVDFGSPQKALQTVALNLATTELLSDGRLPLSATSSAGLPVTFQVISGPATIEGNLLVPTAAAGSVTVRAVQSGTAVFAPAELDRTITIIPASRLINLSSRAVLRAGDAGGAFIAGFVVSAPAAKQILVRAVGPALGALGVDGTLSNPRLRVFDGSGQVVAENDDWSGADLTAAFARVGAFTFPAGSRDAALLATLAPGAYSLHVESAAGAGVALAEVYDASGSPALESQQVVNISTRAFVDRGAGVLAAGFVVTGGTPKRVLIRGIGPGLAAFGVSSALADPVMTVYQEKTILARNDDWSTPQPVTLGQPVATAAEIAAASTAAGAFALTAGSKDAALILLLAPGAYTAVVSGAGDSTGAGMVEVYQLP